MAIRQITFNYNANGGSGAPASSTDSFNVNSVPFTKTKQIASAKPSRTYYSFLGWGSSPGATSATWSSSQTLSFTWASLDQGNVTMNFYAVWKHATAVVSYNANGGSGAPTAQTVNQYEWFTLRTGVPTRQYYDFVGWATSATATVKQYDPGDSARIVGNMTLYAVWKKSADVISTSNGTMGSAMTLNITKIDNSYKDTITYQFGSATGTIASGTTATTISWTPPTSLAAQIPNASSGSLVLTCSTYNAGGTLVGTSTTTVTLSVPQSLAPTVSVAFTDTNATCSAWGVYVQSRSTLSFVITASGQESATIASYRTTVNGTQYNSDTFTTDVLLYNGSNSYTTIVTDSRGMVTTVTGTFNVVAYSTPTVSLTSCDRNDSDAEQVDITFDFDVAPVSNNNTAQYAIDYKTKSSSTWTQGTVISCGGYSGTISDSLSSIDQGDEYDIRVRVIDAFQDASVETEVGVSGNILLNQRHVGGAGILMKSQAQNQLDIGKQTVFHERVLAQFGSTVATHSTSGSYAKVVTFGTDVTVGKNLAPVNAWNTGRRWWGSNINSAGLLGSVLETLPVGTYTISWKYTLTAIPDDTTTTLQVGKYVRVKYDGTYHILSSYSLTTIPSYAVGDTYSVQATITIDSDAVGQAFEVLGYCGQSDSFYATLTEYQIEIGSEKTSFEPYVNTSDINVNAPLTLEYIKTGDSAPSRLTIGFNRDYTLNSFTSDNSVDAYLHNSSTAHWDLYIGKDNNTDSVEILDMHNPWSNTDMVLEWDDSSVSTLPTGAVQVMALPKDLTNSYGDLANTGRIYSHAPSAVNLAASTWKTIAQLALPAGKYVVAGNARFPSNSTGRRTVLLSTSQDSSTDLGIIYTDTQKSWSDGSGYNFVGFCAPLSLGSANTIYLNAWQNSGSALSTYGRLYVIRIA